MSIQAFSLPITKSEKVKWLCILYVVLSECCGHSYRSYSDISNQVSYVGEVDKHHQII
jgi:hypothetical protein